MADRKKLQIYAYNPQNRSEWECTTSKKTWLSFVMSKCDVVTFQLVSWVRCGAWLYRFLIFALFLTLSTKTNPRQGKCFKLDMGMRSGFWIDVLFLLCPRYQHKWFDYIYTEFHKPDPFEHFIPTWKQYITQVNRMSKSRRVLATGGKQRSFGLHMVCFEMVLYHNEPH